MTHLFLETGAPQDLILLLFLIYINYSFDNFVPNLKLFANDTSQFSVVSDNFSEKNLNNNLNKINNCVFKWNIILIQTPKIKLRKLFFLASFKNHPTLYRLSIMKKWPRTEKHFGMFFNTKLDFQEHIKNISNKVNKAIGLLRKLQMILSRSSQLRIYKSFIRPPLDNGDIIYDQIWNASSHQKLESFNVTQHWLNGRLKRGFYRETVSWAMIEILEKQDGTGNCSF